MDWISLLIWTSSVLGVQRIPDPSQNWSHSGWVLGPTSWVFSADGHVDCPLGSYLVLPPVIHASHKVFLDDNLVFVAGSPDKASPFYAQPHVPCELLQGKTIHWEASSYTRFFARVQEWPYVSPHKTWQSVFYEPLQSASAVSLLVLGIFVFFVYGAYKIPVILFYLSAWSMSVYFGMSTAILTNISVTPIQAHRVADCAVWIGMVGVFTVFRERKLIPSAIYRFSIWSALLGIVVMISSSTGDEVQLGTMIPFPAGFATILSVTFVAAKRLIEKTTKRRVAEFAATLLFLLSGGNEMAVVMGVLPHSPTFLQIGMTGTIMFLAMALHEDFVFLLAEREMLRQRIRVGDLALKVSNIEKDMIDVINKMK